ncbi:Membrane protein involved in the export of O-antigen and teichoic acid [Micromonospora coriariae]|uniref:Membrane protein involved in the export of O-antigen and teichoic acid n=1 Tax=Micromonospora coriariae TaxID=285665 RepID=A0A1C4V102_9ACTN|nr:oligosaccharide flippase family protein [Micromonospora coriariae]SCE77527.1 Membrane protein involved in the export of O-antigen and teichoic acid [Micromonospora coriariae]
MTLLETRSAPHGRSRGLARRLRQLGLLGISQVGLTLIAFVTQVLLARSMPQAQFGAFMSVLSLMTLAGPVALFGIAEFWLQRFGREGPRAVRWVRPSIALVLACSALQIAVMVTWALLDGGDQTLSGLRILLAPIILAQAGMALSVSVLQLRGAYGPLSVLQLVPHAGRLLVAVLTVLAGLSALAAATGYGLVAAVTVVLSAVVIAPFARGRGPLEGYPPGDMRPGRPPRLRHLLGGAAPFMLGSLFYLLGMNLGVVVSAEFLSARAAAVFAVPMTLLTAIYLLPRVVYQQYFLAKLHRWSRSDREAVLVAYRAGTVGMIALGLLIGVIVAVGGRYAIPLLFGAAYRDSVPVMALLALAIPLRFGSASVASLLTSGGLLRKKVLYQGLGSVVFLGTLALAIPPFGVVGAALATVLSEAILLVLFWSSVKRNVVAGAPLPSWAEIRRRLTKG